MLQASVVPFSTLDAAKAPARPLLSALALCNDAEPGAQDGAIGDPTEVALWRVAAEAGFDKQTLERTAPRVMEIPFDSDRKRMTTFHRDGPRFVAYTKGAPETVLDRCGTAMGRGHTAGRTRSRAGDCGSDGG